MVNRNNISTQERILSRDPLLAYQKVMRRVRFKKTVRRTGWMGMGIICTISVLLWLFPVREAPAPEPQIVTVESGVGMRTSFRLPDSTMVYLNSGTKLMYPVPFNKEDRWLELVGEAYFRVKHMPGHPFRVAIPGRALTIRALGTEFNVEAYEEDDRIHTTLVSGRLQIEGQRPDGQLSACRLNPSEKVAYFWQDGRLEVKTADIVCDTGWMRGKIILKNTPFPEMLRKLTHQYNVDFIVEDSILATYLFTGVLDNRTLSQALDYLEISSGIDYRISFSAEDDSERVRRQTVSLWKREYTPL
ncbi:MAG: DUF4974 domain-containing protein [Tannerellaceae bacterium]|jgi:ferric-dicitrate binding protein FerR (iron transport regulator)|nr:DUF4974 domain-containing protein [Tannerellaceae bacterium]